MLSVIKPIRYETAT